MKYYKLMKNLLKKILTIIELPFLPLLAISAILLKLYRRIGSHNLRKSTYLLKKNRRFPHNRSLL